MKKVVVCRCWNKAHLTELVMNRTQEEKFYKQLKKGKRVCPECKPESQPITILEGQTMFGLNKTFQCSKCEKLHVFGVMGTQINVEYGPEHEDFENYTVSVDGVDEAVMNKEIACHYCKEQLQECDDKVLRAPEGFAAIKTKMRVGDIWDRNNIEPVRSGSYDKNGDYQDSKTNRANIERLKKMNRKRNISEDRLPGKPI